MLVLTRRQGESLRIGDDIVVTILDVRGDSIRVGIDAPRSVRVQRDELVAAVGDANTEASAAGADAESRLRNALGGLGGTPQS